MHFMNFKLLFAILFILVAGLPDKIYSQNDFVLLSIESVILELKNNQRNLEVAYSEDSISLEQLNKLRNNINEFINISSRNDVIFDTLYLKVLQSDVNLIGSLISDSSNFESKLSYLNESFALKNSHGKKYGFHDNGVENKIHVIIHLLKNNKEQKGYEISCNTMFWFNKKPLAYTNDSNSPTDIFLPPGIYMFYVSKNNLPVINYQRDIGQGDIKKQTINFSLD